MGQMDRTGAVAFPGQTFKMNEPEEIKKWLDEIKVYGAQGSPEGKKLWGRWIVLGPSRFQVKRSK